jgi:SAM-dependent methyltransferase
MPFVVPTHLLRNAASVLQSGAPADVGAELLDYIARRLQRTDLAELDVLDVGCGTRFADTLMNRDVRIGSYLGLDVDRELVDFLQAEAIDPRLRFQYLHAYNSHCNPAGSPLSPFDRLPVGPRRFNLVLMLALLTHLHPADARALFSMVRRYVRPGARLFFTARIDTPEGVDFVEDMPAKPGARCRHSRRGLERMLAASGWRIVDHVPAYPEDLPLMDSFVCAPAEPPSR